ncbi:MAG: type II toxin-antitoxin system death-on-curing family toxin [Usitatibacter sp.]
MTSYITSIEVMVIHRALIDRYGGRPGLRDAGALESALFRPQSGYYPDVVAQAAALFESLAINHPFVDANKRVAFACVDVFLRINGFRLKAGSGEVLRWMIGHLEKGAFRMDAIEPWLRRHARKA